MQSTPADPHDLRNSKMTVIDIPGLHFKKRPLVVAHRGASRQAPENTLCAFRKALEMGADGLELDVRFSADGVPVVIHDERLERTSTGSGRVSDLPLSSLCQLDAGRWFGAEFQGQRIPRLEAAAAEAARRRALLLVEIKSEGEAAVQHCDAVVQVLKRSGALELSFVQSFDLGLIKTLKRRFPIVKTAALFDALPSDPIQATLDSGARALVVRSRRLGRRLLQDCHRNGLPVIAWTVNSRVTMRRLISQEVDGIITDFPARLLRLRGRIE